MDKHTKHLLFFFGTLLLASVTAFCIMFVLPMLERGRSPPIAAECTITSSYFFCKPPKSPDLSIKS